MEKGFLEMPAPLALKERLAAVRSEVELFAGGGSIPSMEDLILTADRFSKLEMPPRAIYLDPWLRERSLIMVAGRRGTGKTFFALGVLDALTTGKPFGPWGCPEPVKCLYVDGEMVPEDVKNRLEMFGIAGNQNLLIYSDAYVTQRGQRRANLLDEGWRQKIKDFLLKNQIKIVVFDNLSSLCPGIDENSKQDYDPVNQFFLALRFCGVTTIFLHHTGNAGTPRGTSAREDNIDMSIGLKLPEGYVRTDGCRFDVSFTKARIETASLRLIADTEMRLIEGPGGLYQWTYAASKEATMNTKAVTAPTEVKALLDAGISQKEIAARLGISEGRVSQIKKSFISLVKEVS